MSCSHSYITRDMFVILEIVKAQRDLDAHRAAPICFAREVFGSDRSIAFMLFSVKEMDMKKYCTHRGLLQVVRRVFWATARAALFRR